MEKRIEDYLHFYLGCKVKMMGESEVTFTLKSVSSGEAPFNWIDVTDENGIDVSGADSDCFPILRPLSDMTEGECEYVSSAAWQGKPTIFVNAELTVYYLKCGFDLFGLIEAGIAIDKTKLISL